jgi:mannose-6-phosphate isomerase-like protein (cupin superfamily)
MLEQVFRFQRTDEQVIEQVVDGSSQRLSHITHGVLPPGEATPHERTDAEVSLILVRGNLALRIADQIIHTYEAGTILAVPAGITMELRSAGPEALEYFAIEAPLPQARTFSKAGMTLSLTHRQFQNLRPQECTE